MKRYIGCSSDVYLSGLVTISLCTTFGGLSRHPFRFSTQPMPRW
jgi:hypothetical protein